MHVEAILLGCQEECLVEGPLLTLQMEAHSIQALRMGVLSGVQAWM